MRIDWKTNDTGNPNSATSVANKYINITNISATFTINSITFNYDAADETNEANFTVFRYSLGTWTQVSTTLNATGNKATITSITNPGVYALFEYSPQSNPQASTSGSNGDERIRYRITHESECGNNTVILGSQNGQIQGVRIFIIENDQIIREGTTDERGEFRYQLNEEAQIQIRIGSSSFFGPFAINHCQNNQTQYREQNQTTPQIIGERNEQQNEENRILDEPQKKTELPDQVQETKPTKSNSTTTAAQNQDRSDNTQETQGRSKNAQIDWPLGIIVILILGAGVYYFFIRKK